AIICFDASSHTSELISRATSDSKCVSLRPSRVKTSMPLRKLPAHKLPASSKASAEIRLLVGLSGSHSSPKLPKFSIPANKRPETLSSCQPARRMPSLLSSHNDGSPEKTCSWQDERVSGRFQKSGFSCAWCVPASGTSRKTSPLSLLSRIEFP